MQLAAFTDDKGANALANKLKRAGYSAYTEPVETTRGTLWRVRVGGYGVEARGGRRAREAQGRGLQRHRRPGVVIARRRRAPTLRPLRCRMNGFDLALIADRRLSTLFAFVRGVVRELIALATWIVGLVAAFAYSGTVANWLSGLRHVRRRRSTCSRSC